MSLWAIADNVASNEKDHAVLSFVNTKLVSVYGKDIQSNTRIDSRTEI
ncbi:hypothetical protein HDF26_000640 [Pedobacter cryoconitis]|nr:hypothetical protein [Pedobacter cryoconitis]